MITMEQRIEKLEEGQKRIEVRLDRLETRLENFEAKVESAFNTLIGEVRITNSTLQGVFNVGFESYKNIFAQKEAAAIIAKAYEEAYKKLNREII